MRTAASEGSPRANTVGVLGKAIDVLEALVWGPPRGVREMASATGIDKAAVYRILNSLTERGFAAKDDETKTYGPGPRLLAAASMLTRVDDLVPLARPYLAQVRDRFGETVNLGVLVGPDVQYLEILESSHSLRMAAEVGSRDPAHATALGKAILSRLDSEAIAQILGTEHLRSTTNRTIVDLARLRDDLAGVAARGYAIDNEENEIGAVCVAAPVPTEQGEFYALSVSSPASRMNTEVIDAIGQDLVHVASKIAGR